jgi:hypothetical protein
MPDPTDAQLAKAATQLVKRARLGDQNAVAMIVQVRKNAEKGNPRALRMRSLLKDAIEGKMSQVGHSGSPLAMLRDGIKQVRDPEEYASHVAAYAPQVGTDVRSATNAAQAISRGPRVNRTTLSAVQATFGSEPEQKAFAWGAKVASPRPIVAMCKQCTTPEAKTAMQMGYTMGFARRLQAARAGHIQALSRKAAWELT